MFCLSPFCCVCLKNKEEFFNLNNIDADYLRLWDKLLYCMPEIEDIIEDIPLFICRECRRVLRISYSFRKKFVENFQYVDDYIRQLTYADKPVDGTEHADLCVTLVDCKKRFQHSISKIKTESSECIVIENTSNSVDYYDEIRPKHTETDDECSICSDTENIPLSTVCNQENHSTGTSNQSKENSNQEKLRQNWETFKNTIEIPVKRRKLDDSSIAIDIIDVNDIKDDDDENITIVENSILSPENNSSSEEASVVFNDHLNDISSNTIVDRQVHKVQNVSKDIDNINSFQEGCNETEEQSITNEKPAELSNILVTVEKQNIETQEVDQDIDINNKEQDIPSVNSIVLEQHNLLQASRQDLHITSSESYELNTEQQAETSDNSHISKEENEYRSSNLQATCDNQDHIQTSSNSNTEGNAINQLKTNTESLTAKQAVQTKQCETVIQSDTSRDLKPAKITQAAKENNIHKTATGPDDSVTNALFQSIRNSDRTSACIDNGDDSSSRPSVATSMYESDIIDGIDYELSENSDDYISDNDELCDTSDYRQTNVYVDRQSHHSNVSSVYNTDYSDISSPDNAADMHMFSPNYETNANEHHFTNQESRSVSRLPEHGDAARHSVNDPESSSTPLVHIKSVTSDVEDNYSNETVLYQDNVQQDTGNTVGNHISAQSASKTTTSFSFLRAYLDSTKANVSIDMNTTSEDNNSIDIAKTKLNQSISNQETIDKSKEKNLSVSLNAEHVNNTPCTSNDQISTSISKDTEATVGKSVTVNAVPEETKKTVYTSIRKKIPRLIDLNGSIRKNVSSVYELFTCNICNNKYSSKYLLTMHTQQAHVVNPTTNTNHTHTFSHTEDANIQQEILLDCQAMLKDCTDITDSTTKTLSSNVAGDILQSSHETSSNKNSNPTEQEYKCHVCDMTFNYQSLLDCHLEKHAGRTVVDPLPDIITNRNTVHDEHLLDKCPVCDVQFQSQSLLACHLQTHNIRMSDLSRVNSSGMRNGLSRYKIPHLNQSNRPLVQDNNNETTRGAESVNHHHDAQDKCESTMSSSEKMKETLVNKHKIVDETTDTTNYLTNKLSTDNKTKQLLQQKLYTSDTTNLKNQTSKTIKHIDDKTHFKHTLIDKRCETKHTEKSVNTQSKSNVTDTDNMKHHHSSTSSSKKKDKYIGTDDNPISMNGIQEKIRTNHSSHSNNEIKMIDKATGTIDFSDNSTEIYSFTDAIEENMYRIHLGEINHSEHVNNNNQTNNNNNQTNHSNEQLEKESSNRYGKKVINGIQSHKHKHRDTATVTKVDNSTETTNLFLPTTQCVTKSVVDDNVQQISSVITSSSLEQPQSKVTAGDVTNNNHAGKELDTCPLCKKTFVNFNSLREHLIIQHKAYKKFQCTLCEKNFRQRSTLRCHMLNRHAKAELFVCPVCHKNFSGKFPLKRHMTCHYGEKPFKCTMCDKTFRYKESVKTHMVLHTGVKAYKCPYCDKAFAFKGNMVKHVQTHTKAKRYPCPLCDKDFSTNFVLKQHMRTHTGERPYKCPICHRAFTVRQTMIQHISIHTDEKPFQCTICTARFKRKQHLRRHMYVHTEDKPYKCTVCDKDFRLKTELNKHIVIHCKTNQPYTCDICNIGYSSSGKLYEHNFNIHYKKDITLNSVILSETSHT